MNERIETDIRARAVEQYKLLSIVHFSLGFLLLFFASYVAMKIHGEGTGVFPYYIPSIISSFLVLALSVAGVAIYDRGQHEYAAELVHLVKPVLNVHFLLSFPVSVGCIVGFVITIVYGLCPASAKCSYSTKHAFNYGMAAFLMCLQLLGLATSIFSKYLFHHYRNHFVVHSKSQETFPSHVDFQNDM